MASRRKTAEPATPSRRPATTPEARESELISLAMDVAEKQMREGTASSQVITTFLKAGSVREQLEQERLQHELELSRVKKEAMEKADRMESLMEDAINAMRSYKGSDEMVEVYDDED